MEKKIKSNSKLELTHAIRSIISEHKIKTQQELIEKLQVLNIDIQQSYLSRLLPEMGIMKSIDFNHDYIYHLPWETSPPTPQNALHTLIKHIKHNEHTIVISTSPGAAQLVARMLDFYKEDLEILGTIAGDDMIFIAPNSIKNIVKVVDNITSKFFGGV